MTFWFSEQEESKKWPNHNYFHRSIFKRPCWRHNGHRQVTESDSYIGSDNALLCHHEDEADEDGWAQHADGAHERVGSLCLLAAQARGGRPDDHAQQARHTGDCPED